MRRMIAGRCLVRMRRYGAFRYSTTSYMNIGRMKGVRDLLQRSTIVGVIAISLLTLLAACGGGSSGGNSSEQGVLSGKITIGPACPAEPCGGPPGAIYMGRDLILWRSGASSFKVPWR